MNKPLTHARETLSLTMRDAKARHVTLWSTVLYALIYLWAIGDINFHGWRPGFSVIWVEDITAMFFKQRNLFYFEGIAIITLPFMTFLLSPINILFALVLALLVGLNLTFSYVSLKKPRACRGSPIGTLLASLPALLTGVACSAPIILVLLGIQASEAILAFFSALVPIALVLLLITLAFNIARTNTDALARLERYHTLRRG